MGGTKGGCALNAMCSLFSVEVSTMPLHDQRCQEGPRQGEKKDFENSACLKTYPVSCGSLYSAADAVSNHC